MLKAYITRTDKLSKRGYKYILSCPELNLQVEDFTPSHALCRKIMEHFPERGDESLEVYRGETPSMAIKKISVWGELATSEQDKNGLQTIPYKPYPKAA